jgi:hypothetical protein
VNNKDKDKSYDKYAAGPIGCSKYLSKGGIQTIVMNTVHTEPPKDHHR